MWLKIEWSQNKYIYSSMSSSYDSNDDEDYEADFKKPIPPRKRELKIIYKKKDGATKSFAIND